LLVDAKLLNFGTVKSRRDQRINQVAESVLLLLRLIVLPRLGSG
jgi:hypothetical protein